MGATLSIIDADPDLGEQLPKDEVERARARALARVQMLSPGEWDAAAALEHDTHHRGFMIVDGLLSRTVDVLGRRCVEIELFRQNARGDDRQKDQGDEPHGHESPHPTRPFTFLLDERSASGRRLRPR